MKDTNVYLRTYFRIEAGYKWGEGMSEIIIPKTKEEKRQEMLDEWEKQRIRAKSKKWYQENKEQKMEYCKEYYQTNKKLINAKLSEKV